MANASGIGPYADQVNYDLTHPYDASSGHGIVPDLHALVAQLTQQYDVGIYAATSGTHASGSLHYAGQAIDVDTINGQTVGNNPILDEQFAQAALTADPSARVGSYAEVYQWLEDHGAGNRAFLDAGTGPHVHVETTATAAPRSLLNPWWLNPFDPNAWDPKGTQNGGQTWGGAASNLLGISSTQINTWLFQAGAMAFFVALLAGGFAILAATAASSPEGHAALEAAAA